MAREKVYVMSADGAVVKTYVGDIDWLPFEKGVASFYVNGKKTTVANMGVIAEEMTPEEYKQFSLEQRQITSKSEISWAKQSIRCVKGA